MTWRGPGGVTISQLVMEVSFRMRDRYRDSREVYIATAVPDRLARPVRPLRCRNDSTSCRTQFALNLYITYRHCSCSTFVGISAVGNRLLETTLQCVQW